MPFTPASDPKKPAPWEQVASSVCPLPPVISVSTFPFLSNGGVEGTQEPKQRASNCDFLFSEDPQADLKPASPAPLSLLHYPRDGVNVVKIWALELHTLDSSLGCTSCVALDKLLNLSESHFPLP